MRKNLINTLLASFATMFVAFVSFSFVNQGKIDVVNADSAQSDFGIALNECDSNGNTIISYHVNDNLNAGSCSDVLNLINQDANDLSDYLRNSFKCEINIHRDCAVPELKLLSMPIEVILNLHGHTLTLSSEKSWRIYGGLTINGDYGTLNFVLPQGVSSSECFGGFWVRAGVLNVEKVTVKGFIGDLYPVFNVTSYDGTSTPRSAFFDLCTFNNCSGEFGGAISVTSLLDLEVKSCTFENCTSTEQGGAICIRSYSNENRNIGFILSNSKFKNCSSLNGGAIYLSCTREDASFTFEQFLTDSDFENCSATENGGAIYMKSKNAPLNLGGSTITKCSAAKYGGAVYISGDDAKVSNGEISSCSATCGGGVFFSGYGGTLNYVKIHNCSASAQGGAFYTDGTRNITVSSCNFSANTPSDGVGTILGNGSLVVIISILLGIFIAVSVTFLTLYLKEKNKTLVKKA